MEADVSLVLALRGLHTRQVVTGKCGLESWVLTLVSLVFECGVTHSADVAWYVVRVG